MHDTARLQPETRFDDVWPTIDNRLRSTLQKRGVPRDEVDDLLQETALRLYRSWHTVDPQRPILPFATTIAMNAWRDILRRDPRREIPGDLPEQADASDVERTVLSRLEVSRVSAALQELSPNGRAALMAGIDEGEQRPAASAAHRMARMRARRELIAILERASLVLPALALVRKAFQARPHAVRLAGYSSGLVSLAGIATLVVVTPATPRVTPLESPVVAQRTVAVEAPVKQLVAVARPASHVAPVRHVAKKHKHVKPTCVTAEQSDPKPDSDPLHGSPVTVTVLGHEVTVDVVVPTSGTKVHAESQGCTDLVAP